MYACERWGNNSNVAELLLFTYACERWGNNSNVAELCYRSGIKVALDVRQNLNNEITYIESGKFPLECKVK